MVIRSSASTYHIQLYLLVMNEVEKCEFIYHAVVSLSCIFLSAQNMLKNQHVLLVTANCHHVLKSFQINCSICNKRSYWDDIGPFGGIKTDHVDLSIPSCSGYNLTSYHLVETERVCALPQPVSSDPSQEPLIYDT